MRHIVRMECIVLKKEVVLVLGSEKYSPHTGEGTPQGLLSPDPCKLLKASGSVWTE